MLTTTFITQLKKINRYNFGYLEITLGQCFDKNLTNQIRDFFSMVQQQPTKNVLLIFSQVEAMDSTGIGILVNFQEELEQNHFSLKLVNVSNKILHLFEILGLANFFHIHPTVSDALSTFFPESERAFFSNPDWEKEISEVSEIKKEYIKKEETAAITKAPNENLPLPPKISQIEEESSDIETFHEAIDSKSPQKLAPITPISKPTSIEDNDDEIFPADVEDLPSETKAFSTAKRLHTIKIKKTGEESTKSQRTLKIEYYTRMICSQEFPLRILFLGSSKKDRTWEIVPKISGCVIVPQRISINDCDLPAEFIFSVTPLSKTITSSEIILTSKHEPFRLFPLKINIVSIDIPKLLFICGIIFFFLSSTTLVCTCLLKSFSVATIPDSYNPALFLEITQIIGFIFGGISLYGFVWSFVLLSGAFLYYHYFLHPKKTSTQVTFL